MTSSNNFKSRLILEFELEVKIAVSCYSYIIRNLTRKWIQSWIFMFSEFEVTIVVGSYFIRNLTRKWIKSWIFMFSEFEVKIAWSQTSLILKFPRRLQSFSGSTFSKKRRKRNLQNSNENSSISSLIRPWTKCSLH